MISKEQCRAARALLDWTQGDLAHQAGFSKTAINNFERGTSNVLAKTLAKIEQTFLLAGIEFFSNKGVSLSHTKPEDLAKPPLK